MSGPLDADDGRAPAPAPAPARSPWPRGRGALLLTAFLSAATVPALLSWTSHEDRQVLQSRQGELDELLRAGVEVRRESLPSRVVSGAQAAELVGVPSDAGLRFKSELLFSDAQIELFRQKSEREGEIERTLKPPDAVTAKATRDEIEVEWTAPADLDAVRASLRDQPLLRLGFRVYRWREGEEPTLLTTFEGVRTAYQDRDLPLWRERFFYCVATVLEGTIGDLPTLIESKRSPVITAETLENYLLAVVDGTDDSARLELSAWLDGQWRKSTLDVGVGTRITAESRRTLEGRDEPFTLDTGLTVRELRWVDGQLETSTQRPEFLPDGKRRLDPATGLPTFRTEPVSVPTRTLTVILSEPSGATRTISSAEPR